MEPDRMGLHEPVPITPASTDPNHIRRMYACMTQGCPSYNRGVLVHGRQMGPFTAFPDLRCTCGAEPVAISFVEVHA